VTQTINGVDHVIYMDPYTSTRWNVTSANIDLYLNDPQIVCGGGNQNRPPGTQTFYTLVGLDDVYQIAQTAHPPAGNPNSNASAGLFSSGGLSNVAYGDGLNVFANFGQNLSNGNYYYRMSYSSDGTNFTAAPTPTLSDTRVNKITNFSESSTLGPMPVGGETGLYQVRNFNDYAWYNPDFIYSWDTTGLISDTAYTLRLEVFDSAGNKLTAANVDYLDGTTPPPNTLPASAGDYCDLQIRVDNDPPYVDLEVPSAINECGVVPCGSTPDINITITQPHNRLYDWGLSYEKGLVGGYNSLASNSSGGGVPNVVNQVVSGTPIINSFTCPAPNKEDKCPSICVCAFGLYLSAWPLVRNGYGFINYRDQLKSIAVEKCV
jgi:hypothetical protein